LAYSSIENIYYPMMFKRATCVGIIALILLLAVPLFVVFKYEEHLLGVENPEEIKIAL
jgi:hypothetical protein